MEFRFDFHAKFQDVAGTVRTISKKALTFQSLTEASPIIREILAGGSATIFDASVATSIGDFTRCFIIGNLDMDIEFTAGAGGVNPWPFTFHVPAGCPFPLFSGRAYDGAFTSVSGTTFQSEAGGGANAVIDKIVIHNAKDTGTLTIEAYPFG